MKLKLTFFFLSLFIYHHSNAQKVDLDRAYASYSYTSLPTTPLPPEYKTFNAFAIMTSPVPGIEAYEIEERGNITGFQKLDRDAKADLTVFLKFGNFMIDGAEVKERVEISKDKAGNETGRKYYYWAEITYSFSGNIRLANNVIGKDLFSNTLQSPSSKLTHKSEEYSTRAGAAGYWNNNKETIRAKLFTDAIIGRIAEGNSILTNKYGYRPAKATYLLWFQGEKKHSEYELNNKMIEQLKTASTLIKADQPITSEIKENFKPIIDYFNDVKIRFNKDDKNDRKMRYSAFYNLGYIYIMLEDYESARKEADGLFTNDYDKNDSKDIYRDIEYAEGQLKMNNTNTRHFVNLRVPAEKL